MTDERKVDSLGRSYISRKKLRPCAQCGDQIKRKGTAVKYCSRKCYGTAAAGVPKPPEQVAARQVPRGDKHWAWSGASVSEKGGRARALRQYRSAGRCSRCAATRGERHHKDGNTANNDTSNVEILCRRCHMEVDGRLALLIANPGKGCVCP